MKNIEKYITKKTQVFTEKDKTVIFIPEGRIVLNKPYKNINSKLVLSSQGENVFNEDLKTDIETAKDITSNILPELEKIKLASKFCGKDDLRPIMNNVFISNGDVVATDAHILVKYSNCASLMDFDRLLFNSNIVGLLEGAKVIKQADKFIYIEHNDFYVISFTDSGKYPNYNAVIVRNDLINKAVNIQINEDFKQALNLTNTVTNCINIYDDKVKYYIEQEAQINEFDIKQIDVKLNDNLTVLMMPIMGDTKTPNNQDISLNCKTLKKIVDAFKLNSVNINIADANKPMLITFEQEKTTIKKPKPKTMEKQETKSVDTDILSALMQQINALTQQVAELKNQQISAPKIDSEPIKESAKIEAKQPINTEKPIIKVQKYSEKSLIVYGDTKLIKAELMELHARFNPFLKLDEVKTPGWIVSVKHEGKINQIVQAL
jgi:hypothetical protein